MKFSEAMFYENYLLYKIIKLLKRFKVNIKALSERERGCNLLRPPLPSWLRILFYYINNILFRHLP